jgi:hypothetical protein
MATLAIELQTVTAGIHLRVSRAAKSPLFASLQDATHQCLTVMATTPDAIKRGAGVRGELFINTNLFLLAPGEPERLLEWLETDACTATEGERA